MNEARFVISERFGFGVAFHLDSLSCMSRLVQKIQSAAHPHPPRSTIGPPYRCHSSSVVANNRSAPARRLTPPISAFAVGILAEVAFLSSVDAPHGAPGPATSPSNQKSFQVVFAVPAVLACVPAPNVGTRPFPSFQPRLLAFCSVAQGGLVVG